MKFEVELESKFKTTAPICRLGSGSQKLEVQCKNKINKIETDLQLKDNDHFEIEFTNKDDSDDNVVLIKSICIDGINLQHFIYKGVFRPSYNEEWLSQQEFPPPEVYQPCTELRHNGVWRIAVSTPVWKMIMDEWTNDER